MADPAPPRAPGAEPDTDLVADARTLATTAIGLGSRLRATRQQGIVTQRRAALYVSTLVRHAARLLQGTETHGVPVLHAGDGGPGRRVTHWVIRSDALDGAPPARRLLVVGSDGRLRCCVIGGSGAPRVWSDYDVGTAPEALSQRIVLQALSGLIGQLERTVTDLEIRQITRDAELDADIALSKARIAGLVDQPAAPVGTRGPAVSEEPVRPWTRHGATAARLMAQQATQRARPPAPDAAGAAPPHGGDPAPDAPPGSAATLISDAATATPAPAASRSVAAPPHAAEATADVATRKPLRFERLGNSI